uniref:Uncharacterized protein n=1 Tax=Glossina pallidipes TaxID=7398 RepID=A0A1B0A486_GLOPL
FDKLDDDQVEYAANDAFAGVEIFKHLANRLKPRNYWNFTNTDFMAIKSEIKYFLDLDFSEDTLYTPITLSQDIPITLSQDIPTTRLQCGPLFSKHFTTPITLLSKRDYLLEAPSGRRLCVVSKSKAEWYLEERLGEKIQSEALTIRLYNNPFAEDNSYWQTTNQHECVVCGQKDAFVCKNVVPSEYRTHFPLITQFFTSSDVLHLCPKCNDLHIISDIKIGTALSRKCDAPYSFDQVTTHIYMFLLEICVRFEGIFKRVLIANIYNCVTSLYEPHSLLNTYLDKLQLSTFDLCIGSLTLKKKNV